MIKNFAVGFILAMSLVAASAGASTINVQFEGQWVTQGSGVNFILRGQPVTASPVNFVANILFDTAAFLYAPPAIYAYPNPNGMVYYSPPSIYSYVGFNDVAGTTSVFEYGVANPYIANGVAQGANLSLQYENLEQQQPDISRPNMIPNERFRFNSNQGSSQRIEGGSANWLNSFMLQSQPVDISSSVIGMQGSADFKEFFQNAFETNMLFSARFDSYSYVTAPFLNYPTTLQVTGSARITSVTEINAVPEPGTTLLISIAAMAALAARCRRMTARV